MQHFIHERIEFIFVRVLNLRLVFFSVCDNINR